jgi:WD40 repeat protein
MLCLLRVSSITPIPLRLSRDLAAGKVDSVFMGHGKYPVHACTWLAESKLVASAAPSPQRDIVLWDTRDMGVCGRFRGHTHPVEHLLPIPEKSLLLSLATDKTVKLWSLGSGDCVFSVTDQASV